MLKEWSKGDGKGSGFEIKEFQCKLNLFDEKQELHNLDSAERVERGCLKMKLWQALRMKECI